MMAWRRDPPAARLIQALPIVPAGPRRTRANTPTTPDIRPPTTDFADPLEPLTDVNWREPPLAGEKRIEDLNRYEDKNRRITMKSRIALRPILTHSGHTEFSEENE